MKDWQDPPPEGCSPPRHEQDIERATCRVCLDVQEAEDFAWVDDEAEMPLYDEPTTHGICKPCAARGFTSANYRCDQCGCWAEETDVPFKATDGSKAEDGDMVVCPECLPTEENAERVRLNEEAYAQRMAREAVEDLEKGDAHAS